VVEKLRGFRRHVDFRILSTAQLLNLSTIKKPGGENSFSPRVEVIDWNYETAS
jgi:hypothetical protein